MAQPVFDGHPLEEYFEDSGEAAEPMPGGVADFSLQSYLIGHPSTSKYAESMEKLCFLILDVVQSLRSLFSPDCAPPRTQAFAERFKYGVISSSLLSSAFATTPLTESHRRGVPPSLPGNLSNNHSRTSSVAESTLTDTLSLSMPPDASIPIWSFTLSFTVALAAVSARFYFFGSLLLAATLYHIHARRRDIRSKPDVMTPSLLALQHLISAGQLWDAVVNDTLTMLESEERSIFYSPSSPLTPSSSLRVALSTSLLTTQTQCDNVRQLLSAITSPSELAQLSEMYAPPSPIKPTFPNRHDSRRPLSHPGSPARGIQADGTKRSTWNGSYASLALAGTPPAFQLARRGEKRRSDLSALIGTATPSPARMRSRKTLSPPPPPLTDVSEEEEGMVTAESSLAEDEEENSFGAAALSLYRNRVSGGMRAFELSPRSAPTPLSPTRGGSTKRRTTMSPGSKYTSMHTTRHPFSLSSLRQSLQNALASKRFACSHLLALRFEDDEDEVYWEDVRSVMSLLTSTFIDASSRLSEVLDEVEERHLEVDDAANESASGFASGFNTLSSPPASPPPPAPRAHHLSQAIERIVSFAPTPTHISRFAAHIGAISSALDDAREQLEHCVAALKDDRTMHSPGHSPHLSNSSQSDGASLPPGLVAAPVADTHTDITTNANPGPNAAEGTGTATTTTFAEAAEHPAIQAYERLRRELGLALRECERGRERLVHIVTPPTPSTEDDADLGPDPGSGHAKADDEGGDVRVTVVSPSGEAVPLDPASEVSSTLEMTIDSEMGREMEMEMERDDATKRLLLATSAAHLPPPGIEQVFEAESGSVGAFTRERSKLSREERIRQMRAQRTGMSSPPPLSLSSSPSSSSPPAPSSPPLLSTPPRSPPRPTPAGRNRNVLGPTEEVVQELKDVIWKVGQRRQKLSVVPRPPS